MLLRSAPLHSEVPEKHSKRKVRPNFCKSRFVHEFDLFDVFDALVWAVLIPVGNNGAALVEFQVRVRFQFFKSNAVQVYFLRVEIVLYVGIFSQAVERFRLQAEYFFHLFFGSKTT